MNKRTRCTKTALFGLMISLAAFAGEDPIELSPPDGVFLIRYAANLTAGDSVINITNTGENAGADQLIAAANPIADPQTAIGAPIFGPGFGGASGNMCVNVYAFSPDEQLVSCCSCLVTPNGLVSLSVLNDLMSNTFTGVMPTSIAVKLLGSLAAGCRTRTRCSNSAATLSQNTMLHQRVAC